MNLKPGDRIKLFAWTDPDDRSVSSPAEIVTVLDEPHNGCVCCEDADGDLLDVPLSQIEAYALLE